MVIKKTHKIIFSIIIVSVVIGFVLFNSQASLNDNIMANNKATVLPIDQMIQVFQNDALSAKEQYINQLVQVKGRVHDITYLNDRQTIILKGVEFQDSYIICDMSQEDTNVDKSIQIGQEISLKGVCKGFLLDVILLNCVRINEVP
ncbi:tRNA anti-like domain containing protein [Croceitalea dokdonensis DOKDO 023]|uniref:tRNA anti-like domain containing protein n=1 Tax=Croceitalea dokdonensis DOKDO 023 TaxID=1300341 RepID=A0A0P7A5K9_9FLAO|nr:hypothetical protein [Croceitalea dokdonensis]KPM31854.1 tRNA anti-like domain containing protein [Croceitalea dokdonensis DOKDO 023]